jgi:cell division septal protein FtsQ
VCILLGGVVALSWAPFLRIHQLYIEGVSSVNTEAVEESVEDLTRGAYFWIFARDNIFLYPKADIIAALLAQYPVFGSVSISPQGFEALKITVKEREPAALWCGEGTELSSSCLSMDESGAAYVLAPDFSGLVYTRYVGPLPDGPMPRQFLTPDTFRALSAFTDEFGRRLASTTISRVVVGEEGEVRIVCSNGFTLIYTLTDNGADVLERYDLALTADPFTAHPLSDFEYLDLRFGDKLYYKLKGSAETSE